MNRCQTFRVVMISGNARPLGRNLCPPHRAAPTIVPAMGGWVVFSPYAYLPRFDRAGTIHSVSSAVEHRGPSSRQKWIGHILIADERSSHARVFCPTLEFALGPVVGRCSLFARLLRR